MTVRPIIFLDFDGVVNTPYILDYSGEPELFMPSDKLVSNFYAVKLLNWIYSKVPYSIVITSTWRLHMTNEELQQTLVNSGLNPEIPIIGITPNLLNIPKYDKSIKIPFTNKYISKHTRRGHEIHEWLTNAPIPYKYPFIILDDDGDMWRYKKYLIKCHSLDGITFQVACKILNRLKQIQEEIECQR